ncbi:MAG: O-antigen ligase family protein [Desulfurivibrionaceae bacterium]
MKIATGSIIHRGQEWILPIARGLLLAELLALFFSTSLAVGVELLVYPLFLFSAELRGRLFRAIAQPMVKAALAWGAVLLVAALYSVADGPETMGNLVSWRKLLLLPMAAAVFDSKAWKYRLVWGFILFTSLGAVLSYLSWFGDIRIYKYPVGIAIINHATQAMVFAVSFFAIAMLIRYPQPENRGWRWFLPVAGLAVCTNLLFITPGRSGYLALLVLAAFASFVMAPGRIRYFLGLGIPLGLALLLFFSPVASQRIMQGFSEIKNYEQSEELTSMGLRVVMWQNTLEIIREKPWFGYGTGGFMEAYRRQVEGRTGWRGQAVGDPHNQFMRIVAEQGILGLAVFFWLIGAFFRQRVTRVYRLMGLGVLLAWCATSMFSAHFSTFAEGRFLYLWCGAMLAGDNSRDDPAA